MKKVLALSALGCIATVGAVFAAFTIDPTTESKEIENENIEVDLTQHVFSTFDRINQFNYLDESGATICDEIPVSNPAFKFKSKPIYDGNGVEVGTTLDLDCNDYTLENLQEYLQWRVENPKPVKEEEIPAWEAKNKELGPRGYAFKYEYDKDFLDRIYNDDVKPTDWEDWQWAIYKTSFSTGLTKSDFKAHADTERTDDPHGLDEFGIIYQDPNENNPNYKELNWYKQNTSMSDWIKGGPGFIIQPDILAPTKEGDEPEVLNKGTILFTGAEMTENLFAGSFTDEEARINCENYLKETVKDAQDKDVPIHQKFSLKIKATEYFKVKEYKLKSMEGLDAMFVYVNEQPEQDLLTSGDRLHFDFPVDENTEALFDNGYIMNRFSIFGSDTSVATRLIPEDADASALGLKVTLNSPLNGKSDITPYFAYGTNKDDPRYNSIYFTNSMPENAVGWLPKKGDVISYDFYFRKTSDPSKYDKINWNGAGLELIKEPTNKLTLEKSEDTYTWDAGANPLILNKNEINRFITPVDTTEYLGTFSMKKNTSDQLELTPAIAKVYYMDKAKHLLPLDSNYDYEFKNGDIVLHAKSVYKAYGINTGCSIVIDIENFSTDPLTAQSAQFTTLPGPVIKKFDVEGGFHFDSDVEPLSGGRCTLELGEAATINQDDTLNINIPIDDNFIKELSLFIDDKDEREAHFTFVLKDADGNQIDLTGQKGEGDLEFEVLRDSGDPEIGNQDDTKNFKYMGTSGVGSLYSDLTDKKYCSLITDGYKKKFGKMVFNITYAGKEPVSLKTIELQFSSKKVTQ